MALQDQVIPIPFGSGINTKSDPKALQGKLLQLQDGVFGVSNRISKRNGYTQLLSQQSLLTRSFDNQLILADGNDVYSYASDTNILTTVGTYQSASVTPTNVPILNSRAFNIRSAYLSYSGGTYLCTTYSLYSNNTGTAYLNVIDATTGLVLIADTVIVNWTSNNYVPLVTPFAIGANTGSPKLGFIYNDPSNGYKLFYGEVVAPFNNPFLVTSGIMILNSAALTPYPINSGSATSYISYVSTGAPGNVAVSTLVAHAITGTVNLGTNTGNAYKLESCFDTSGNIWVGVAFLDSPDRSAAGTAYFHYAIASASLTLIKATTEIYTYVNSTTGEVAITDPSSIALSPLSNGNVNYYLTRVTSVNDNLTGVKYHTFATYQSNLTPSSFTVPTLYLQNAEIQTNFVTVTGGLGNSSGNYGVFANVYPQIEFPSVAAAANGDQDIGTQNNYFLVNEVTKSVVGKCLAGEARPLALDSAFAENLGGVNPAPACLSVQSSGPNIYFGGLFTAQIENVTQGNGGGNSLISINDIGYKLEQFNFADAQAYQTQVFQNTLIFNGADLKSYDGTNFTELGFNVFPEFANIVQAPTGGQLSGSSTYGYAITYGWIDNNNQVWESTPQEVSYAISAGTNTNVVELFIETLTFTDKVGLTSGISTPPVYINIYRTDANGSIFYFLNRVLNDRTLDVVSYLDGYGASLVGQPELYTTGGVLPNDPPPASMILSVRENRLYAVDSEFPVTDYWYTKTANKGFGIQFSGFLVETIDALGGRITSQAQMDEKFVTFKTTALGYQVGDGPNDTGNPATSTLSNFQFVPTDTSSDNHRATILIPSGLIFHSPKGIYILDRGLQIRYFGPEVQLYNSQFITAATMLSDVNQVRFLTNAGFTLVFNYFFNQWGIFTNHLGTSSDVFNGRYTYSRTDNTVYIENSTTFLDNATPYALTAQLEWLKFGGIQGFERVKQCFLLGDHLSPAVGHGVQISAAYNYESTFSTPIGKTFDVTKPVFQYREFLPRQKCESLTLYIQEVITGASGEFVDFTDLSLLAAVKKGAFKFSAANSVG